MTASRQKRNAWLKKLAGLADGADKAQEDLLMGIYQARQDGVSYADVAYGIGDKSPSGIPAKVEKGRAVLEKRKGGTE
ncbi:hypothetical protein [Streptomyces sp. NPDC001843]|uniref:hypothetical protein n=1 Tax=Streptomyces sp. NPDC001843 TaxID=3364617 RepID=UPI0036BE5618